MVFSQGNRYSLHSQISIIQTFSVVLAVLAILFFYKALRTDLASYQPLLKLVAFKIIVFLTFLQGVCPPQPICLQYATDTSQIIFWVLRDVDVLNPTSMLTFADLNIGIPTLMTCLEMVPISIFFHFAYSVRPYIIHSSSTSSNCTEVGDCSEVQNQRYHGGVFGFKAWIAMCNPTETLKAISLAVKMAWEWRTVGLAHRGIWRSPPRQGYTSGGARRLRTPSCPVNFGVVPLSVFDLVLGFIRVGLAFR